MPRDVFVQKGLQSPQPQPNAVPKKGILPVEQVEEDTGGVVTFESRHKKYAIQLNTPRERFDQLTGQKVKDPNRVIKFNHGLYTAKSEDEVKAIIGSKFYGAPHKALVWRRSERQKLEVRTAVRDLGVQLQQRPDLLTEVVALIKDLPGAKGLFELPNRNVATPVDEVAQDAPGDSMSSL